MKKVLPVPSLPKRRIPQVRSAMEQELLDSFARCDKEQSTTFVAPRSTLRFYRQGRVPFNKKRGGKVRIG